jgi:hypothetical protein
MNETLTKLKGTNCHGVKKNKKDTSQIEYRFSVEFNSDSWKHLMNFLCDDLGKYFNEN